MTSARLSFVFIYLFIKKLQELILYNQISKTMGKKYVQHHLCHPERQGEGRRFGPGGRPNHGQRREKSLCNTHLRRPRLLAAEGVPHDRYDARRAESQRSPGRTAGAHQTTVRRDAPPRGGHHSRKTQECHHGT